MKSPCTVRRCALAVLLLASAPLSANAQPRAHESEAEVRARIAAKARFERAVRLFEDGNFEAALVEFRTSIVDYPTRTAAVNITICLRKLGRYDEEKDAIDAVERDFPTTKKGELEALARARAEVTDRLGSVAFEGVPDGATVTIDGRERGATPLSGPLSVSAGVRTLRISKAGFRLFERRIDVPARRDVVVPVTLVSETTTIIAVPETRPLPVATTVVAPRAPLWPAWVLGGVGVVSGGVGAFFLVNRASTVTEARDAGCAPNLTSASLFDRCRTLDDRASSRGTLGTVFLAGGGALLVGGAIYLLARGGNPEGSIRANAVSGTGEPKRARPSKTDISMHCAPSGLGALCGGTF